MKSRTPYPRGTSLGELLAVLTGLGVAMAVATGLVHTGMRQQSLSRLELERDRTAMRLARDFRGDVGQAVTLTCMEAENAEDRPAVGETLLQLTLPTGEQVAYRTTEWGLTRVVLVPDRLVHEDYVLTAGMGWSAANEDGCVVLHGTTPPPDLAMRQRPHAAALEIHVVAAQQVDAEVAP